MFRIRILLAAAFLAHSPLHESSQRSAPELREIRIANPHGSSERDRGNSSRDKGASQDKPLFVQEVHTPKTTEEAAKEKRVEDEKAADKRLDNGFTAALVVATCLQAIVALLQWSVLRRQTKLIDKQAEISMNAERASLVETLKFAPYFLLPTEVGTVKRTLTTITFKNYGNTIARITDVKLRMHMLPKDTPLPELPNYSAAVKPDVMEARRNVIPPQEQLMLMKFLEKPDSLTLEDIEDIRSGAHCLYCYGRIDFTDTFNKERHLQFCYQYHMPTGHSPIFVEGFRFAGPPAYNSAS